MANTLSSSPSMKIGSREGCCADWPKPCPYHEGWDDALDAVPDGWAKIDGEWVELRYSHDGRWRKRMEGER